jgi:hypothetical protein
VRGDLAQPANGSAVRRYRARAQHGHRPLKPSPPDPLDEIEAAAALLVEHGFGVIGEFIRTSPELYNHVALVASERGPSALMVARLVRRDELLRETASLHFVGFTRHEQATRLARRLKIYATDAWPRDRLSATNPHPAGTLRGMMWEILKMRPVALSQSRLRRIL